MQTAYALSKIRLFKTGFVPNNQTTLQNLIDQECAYTGYVAGGETITAWLAPLLQASGGAGITMPTEQFAAVAPFTLQDVAGGFWIETAGGIVVAIGVFDTPIPLGAEGQGVPVTGVLTFGN